MRIKNFSKTIKLEGCISDWDKPLIIQKSNEYTIYIIIKGLLDITIGYSNYEMSKNSILFIFPNEKYSVELKSKEITGYKVTYTLSRNEKIVQMTNNKLKENRFQELSLDALSLIEKITLNGFVKRGAYKESDSHILYAFIYMLLENDEQKTEISDNDLTYVEKAIKYMNKNICSKLTLEEISDTLFISKHHFLRLFKRITGYPPITYFMKIKINRAAELLTTTHIPIFKISEILSFSNQAHFSRKFKLYMSVSPSSYRKQHILYKQRYIIESDDNIKQMYSLLQTIIDSSPDLIFYKDIDGVLLGCNDAFCIIMGLKKSEIIGKSDLHLFPKSEANFYYEKDKYVLETGKPQRNIEWMRCPDDTRKKFEVYKSAFFDSTGNIKGIVGISRDITNK